MTVLVFEESCRECRVEAIQFSVHGSALMFDGNAGMKLLVDSPNA